MKLPKAEVVKLLQTAKPEGPDVCSFCPDILNGVHGVAIRVQGLRKLAWVPICGDCLSKLYEVSRK